MIVCSENSVIDSLCDGPVKIVVEILFLIHLVTAFPILMNPPNQFFEGLLRIKTSFGPLRILYRSGVVLVLLLLSLTLPSFGAILDLIGATTITLLNFIFPPFFYLRLADKNSEKRGRVSLGVRLYCWHMILVGTAGGVIAFVSAVLNVKDELSGGESCWKNLF